jgi:hypothetical protein
MEFKINDNGSGLDQDTKNYIIEFIKLCYNLNPVRKKIELILINEQFDFTDLKSSEDKIVLVIKNKSLHDLIDKISKDWMYIFSKSRKINLTGIESELMVKNFYEKIYHG